MTTESTPSVEVFGLLSEEQKHHLGFIAGQIAEAEGLDPTDVSNIELLQDVIKDSILRGLHLRGKAWVGPSENILPIFQDGLVAREKVVESLNSHSADPHVLNLLSNTENNQLAKFSQELTPFSTGMEEAENFLQEIEKNIRTINKFHQNIFDNPTLQNDVKKLKKEAEIGDSNNDFRNQLFANFLAYLALYRKPGIAVEPKDISALADLWSDQTIRESSQFTLEQAVFSLAESMNLNPEVVQVYTKSILRQINNLITGSVDLNTLRSSHIFIFHTQVIELEEKEFSIEDHPIVVEEKAIQEASLKYQEILELNSLFDLSASEEDEIETNPYFEALRELTPLEFLMIVYLSTLDAKVNKIRFFSDLKELVPFPTLVKSLNMALSAAILTEDVKEVMSLTEKHRVATFISEFVLEALVKGRQSLEGIADSLPSSILFEVVNKLNPNSLPEDQKQAIADINEKRWKELILEADLGLEADLNYSDTQKPTLDNVLFPPGSENLRVYLELLPQEKQDRVIQTLWKIIQF